MSSAKPHTSGICLNCQYPLQPQHVFCPQCGQEARDPKLTVRTLFHDFMANYLAFDSKLGRSLLPFFFKPGFLTQRFNQGQRVSYVHPLRLYLIISVLFFFILSAFLGYTIENKDLSLGKIMPPDSMVSDSSQIAQFRQELQEALADNNISAKDSVLLTHLSSKTGLSIDSIIQNYQLTDSLVVDSLISDTLATKNSLTLKEYKDLLIDYRVSDEEVFSSLDIDSSQTSLRTTVKQARKIMRRDLSVFVPFLIQNLPLMMFLLLPFFALISYLLFRKQTPYYLEHVIHALHLHAFSFFFLMLSVLLFWLTEHAFAWIFFLLITVYAFYSFKRVYGQSWLRTFFKFNVVGFLYFTLLGFALLLEVVISFYLF